MINHEKTAEIGTNCGECVFLQHNDETDDSLFSCKLGRLQKYEETSVVELRPDGPFIEDRICIALRPQEWKDELDKSDCTLSDEQKVREEIFAKVDLVLALETDDEVYLNEYHIPYLFRNCELFNSVIVVTPFKHQVDEIYTLLEENLPEGVKYQVVLCLEEDPVVERLVDLGVQKCKGMWYMPIDTVFLYDCSLSSAFTEFNNLKAAILNLDEYVNGHVNPVQYVAPDFHLNRMLPEVIGVAIHKLANGNDGGYIKDKLEALAEKQDAWHMLHKWEQINAV